MSIGCKGPTGSTGSTGPMGPEGGPGPTPTNTPGPKRVFVTSTLQDGNLGGLSGADAICQTLGDSADPGSIWIAWLSDTTENAMDRLANVGPWYRMDGVGLVFTSKDSITSWPIAMISLREDGSSTPVFANQWTGTTGNGNSIGNHCSDWSSTASTGWVGENFSVTASWTSAGNRDCNELLALYCFEQ